MSDDLAPRTKVLLGITGIVCVTLAAILAYLYDNTNLGKWIEQNIPDGWWAKYVVLAIFAIMIATVFSTLYLLDKNLIQSKAKRRISK